MRYTVADVRAVVYPPPPLALVVCLPAPDPEGRPVGLYPNVDGRVVDYVYPGDEPDPSVPARLEARLEAGGLVIVSYR